MLWGYKHHVDVAVPIDIGKPNHLTVRSCDKTISLEHGEVPLSSILLSS